MLELINDNLKKLDKTQAWIMNQKARECSITYEELDEYINYIGGINLGELIKNYDYRCYYFELDHVYRCFAYLIDESEVPQIIDYLVENRRFDDLNILRHRLIYYEFFSIGIRLRGYLSGYVEAAFKYGTI